MPVADTSRNRIVAQTCADRELQWMAVFSQELQEPKHLLLDCKSCKETQTAKNSEVWCRLAIVEIMIPFSDCWITGRFLIFLSPVRDSFGKPPQPLVILAVCALSRGVTVRLKSVLVLNIQNIYKTILFNYSWQHTGNFTRAQPFMSE